MAKARAEIAEEDKWDLSVMYASDAAWEAEFGSVSGMLPPLLALRGKLGENAQNLAEQFERSSAIDRVLSKLHTYAYHHHDEDTSLALYIGMKDRIVSLCVDVNAKLSWIRPEVFSIADARLAELAAAPEMAAHARELEMMLHDRPHTLTAPEEMLLSMADDALQCPGKAVVALLNADMTKFGRVADGKSSEPVELTRGNYILMLQSRDREVRRQAFEAFYDTHLAMRNTLATLLDGQVRKQVYVAKARKFGSAIQASLHNDSVDVAVYNALIDAVHAALPAFYGYVALRKRCLKIEGPLAMYDHHVPIVPELTVEVQFDQAKAWVREALAPLGADYVAVIDQAFANRWIDKWENKGKHSGAYSGGCFDSPPFVLLNHQPDLNSAFTLAHELGHSVHTYLSNKTQPYALSQYRIFVAEIASTVNEGLLHHYLLKKATEAGDQKMRAYLLNNHLDEFRTTVFRQTMFAEFERDIHAKVEAGEPLTADSMCEMYAALNKLYFGDLVATDHRIAFEWARIPHFFYNFYVYKYATSLCVAEKVVTSIVSQEPGAVERYLKFLSSGCSQEPLDLLRSVLGIDMTKPDTVNASLANFAKGVAELSTLL